MGDEVKVVVASYLTGGKLPSPRQQVREYEAAYKDLESDYADYYENLDPEEEELRREFYKRHPEVRPKK